MEKYKPVDGAKPEENIIVMLTCIANEFATLNDLIREGVIVYRPK